MLDWGHVVAFADELRGREASADRLQTSQTFHPPFFLPRDNGTHVHLKTFFMVSVAASLKSKLSKYALCLRGLPWLPLSVLRLVLGV